MLAGIEILPFRTPTLAPATHTNTWVVGRGDLVVVDPASPYPEEQAALFEHISVRMEMGERVAKIVLTHHHHDHVMGAMHLASQLESAQSRPPIAAHIATAELLSGTVDIDERIEHNTSHDWGGRRITAIHTPGHAPGHLVFFDEDAHWMIAGDMVAGIGTILLHPAEGDLGDYLASLQKMRARTPSVLLPSHGPNLTSPTAVIDMYVAHRHLRSQQIGEALQRLGRSTAEQLASAVYTELEPRYIKVATLQVQTHLAWMVRNGMAIEAGEAHWLPA